MCCVARNVALVVKGRPKEHRRDPEQQGPGTPGPEGRPKEHRRDPEQQGPGTQGPEGGPKEHTLQHVHGLESGKVFCGDVADVCGQCM